MMNEARGRGGVRNDFTIELDITVKPNNVFHAQATVLFRKKHAPDPPKNIIFQLDETNYEPQPTDEYGQVLVPFSLPNPGNYRLTVFLQDDNGVRKTKVLTTPETAKKSKEPKSLDVAISGPLGSQVLLITVAGDGGKPLDGFEGLIFEGGNRKSFTTDKFGTYEHQTNVNPGDELAVSVLAPPAAGSPWDGVLIGG